MKDKLKPLKIIHIALCVGVAVAFFLVGNLQTLDFLKLPKLDSDSYLYIIFPVLAVVVGNIIYRKQLKNINPKSTLNEKLPIYQTASITRWAFLEGSAFFILFAAPELILIALLLFIYLVFLRPSEEAMAKDFNLYGQ